MPTVVVSSSSVSSPAAASVALPTLLTRIRGMLEDNPVVDYAAGSITNSATTLAVDDYTKWSEGAIVEWDDAALEQARLRTTPSSSPITLVRGVNGTTAVAHSSGVALKLNPRFGDNEINNALTQVVNSWLWPWVWKNVSLTGFTPVSTQRIYPTGGLPADFIDLVSINQQTPASITTMASYGTKGSGLPVTVLTALPAAISTYGQALDIPNLNNVTNTINVRYRAIITTSDIIEGPLADAVMYGAATKLMNAKDIGRTGEDNSLGDATVQVGQMSAIAARYYQEFLMCRRLYHQQLVRQEPPARTV